MLKFMNTQPVPVTLTMGVVAADAPFRNVDAKPAEADVLGDNLALDDSTGPLNPIKWQADLDQFNVPVVAVLSTRRAFA